MNWVQLLGEIAGGKGSKARGRGSKSRQSASWTGPVQRAPSFESNATSARLRRAKRGRGKR